MAKVMAPAATPPTQAVLDRLVELGRTEGLAAGLCGILAEGVPVPRSATGLALVPATADVPLSETFCTGEAPASSSLAEAAGLRLVRLTLSSPDGQNTGTYTAVLLAAVRLGATTRLLDLAVEYVSTRQVEGAPLTDKQLIQAVIAEAAAALELCRHGLRTATTPAAAEVLHSRLADVGWSIVTLFGASGYLRDHAALDFYAAELAYDAWAAPMGAAA